MNLKFMIISIALLSGIVGTRFVQFFLALCRRRASIGWHGLNMASILLNMAIIHLVYFVRNGLI